MSFLEQIQLLKRMDALIKRKATGSPHQFASRIGVSRATIYRYISDLKDLGAPIAYNHFRQSYYYEKEFSLKF